MRNARKKEQKLELSAIVSGPKLAYSTKKNNWKGKRKRTKKEEKEEEAETNDDDMMK